MKIAVGLFYLECNTFNHDIVRKEQFNYAEGDKVLDYINVGEYLKSEGIEIVPTIMASTIPAGVLGHDDYLYFANKILDILEKNKDVDGIFLHLHGSLEAEGIGSGELYLLKKIREIVGYDIPIAIVLDAHANNDPDLVNHVNIIRGYHTIPHHDQPECELQTVKDLVSLVREGINVTPQLGIVPGIISGEKGLTEVWPLSEIMDNIRRYEAMEQIMTASVFMGEPWCDCPNSHLSCVVVPSRPEHTEFAMQIRDELQALLKARMKDFAFGVPVLEPVDALKKALEFGDKPVFLADSGDNTTGGAIGEGTEMLRLALDTDLGDKRVLITPISDSANFKICMSKNVGDEVELTIGTGRDDTSVPVKVKGRIASFGHLLGYLNCSDDVCGECVRITVNPNLDFMLSDGATSFITPDHFVKANSPMEDYDVIVLKQGYLFSELVPFSKFSLMAATKGATYQFLERLDYKRVIRPMFPFEDTSNC